MGSPKNHITIHDIAKELNISASTVSRALNNHHRISEQTRMRVQSLADKYNYRPNNMAASLRKGKSHTVGVIVPNINRSFFSNIIGGLEEVLTTSGYNLIICQTHEKLVNEKSAVQTLLNARVDGILISLSMESKNIDHLKAAMQEVDILFFDRVPLSHSVNSVIIDDFSAAYELVTHLADMGYKRIAHVKGADHINVYAERTRGYMSAIRDLELDHDDAWIFEEEMTIRGGESSFEKLNSLKIIPDAIVCSGDFVAMGVLNSARKAGINVPHQLGVCGFANETYTEFVTPSITTVHQKGSEIGRTAGELFLRSTSFERKLNSTENIVIQPDLMLRESTKREL